MTEQDCAHMQRIIRNVNAWLALPWYRRNRFTRILVQLGRVSRAFRRFVWVCVKWAARRVLGWT